MVLLNKRWAYHVPILVSSSRLVQSRFYYQNSIKGGDTSSGKSQVRAPIYLMSLHETLQLSYEKEARVGRHRQCHQQDETIHIGSSKAGVKGVVEQVRRAGR